MSRSLNLNEVEPRLATRTSMAATKSGTTCKSKCKMQNAKCKMEERPGSDAVILTFAFCTLHFDLHERALQRGPTPARPVSGQQVRVRARDDMARHQLADLAGRLGAGVDGGLHAADV